MDKDIFWGKKRCIDGVNKWLPLRQHLRDTEFVISKLWENCLDEGQRRLITDSLKGDDCNPKKLIKFLALTHDIMKIYFVFQTQPNLQYSVDLDYALLERLERNGFENIINLYKNRASYLAEPRATHHAKSGQAFLEDYGVNSDISSIIGAHHGRPVDSNGLLFLRSMRNSYPRNFF